jgi:hypothetical protein
MSEKWLYQVGNPPRSKRSKTSWAFNLEDEALAEVGTPDDLLARVRTAPTQCGP